MSFFRRFRKSPDQVSPSKEAVLFAQRIADTFRHQFEGYVAEPSVAAAIERTFLAEGCRDYGVVLVSEGKYDKAVEEFKRAYLLIPHPVDFCLIALAYDGKGDYGGMSKALQQAQTELIAPDRAISTPQSLMTWLGVEGAEELGRVTARWIDTYALERVWPDGLVEIADDPSESAPRKQLLKWVSDSIRRLVEEAAEGVEPRCPHCRVIVRPTREQAYCQGCGAVVAIVIREEITPVFTPDTWPGNPALDYVVKQSTRGADWAKRFPALVSAARGVGEVFARHYLSLVVELKREQAAVNFEGLQLLGIKAALPTIFGVMTDYFEDNELTSAALDALAIELVEQQAQPDPMIRRFWFDLQDRPQEMWRDKHMRLGIAAGQLVGDPALGLVAIALTPSTILEYDASVLAKEALFDEPIDIGKRDTLIRGLSDASARFEEKF